MSKLTDKIELISWLRFKTYNLSVARFCKDILNDFAAYLVFMMAGLFTLSAFTQNVTDTWFKSSSIAAATLWLVLVFVRTLFVVSRLNQIDGIKDVVIHILRLALSSALILYSGSNMTMGSSSLIFGLAALSYLFIILFIKIVENLDKSIQSSIWNFDYLLDDLSELKVDEIVNDKYKDYEFNIIRQSRSNIKYYALNMTSKDGIIRYDLDVEVKRKESKTTYLLDHVSHLTERNKSKLSC